MTYYPQWGMEVLPIGEFLDRHKSESEEKILSDVTEIRIREWDEVLKPEFKDKFGIDPNDEKRVSEEAFKQTFFRNRINPEGQIIAHIPKYGVVGSIFSLRVNIYSRNFSDDIFENYSILTDEYNYFTTHNPKGNTTVCPEVSAAFVKVNDKKVKVGSSLVKEALFSAYKNNLKAIAYSRPSSFKRYTEERGDNKSIYAYLKLREKGVCKDFFDAIDFHIKLGAKRGRVVKDGRPADVYSGGYNIIMIYPRSVIEEYGKDLSRLKRHNPETADWVYRSKM